MILQQAQQLLLPRSTVINPNLMIPKPGVEALDFQCSPGYGQDIGDVFIEVLRKYLGLRISTSEMPSERFSPNWGRNDWKGSQAKGLSMHGFCSLEAPPAPRGNLETHCGY